MSKWKTRIRRAMRARRIRALENELLKLADILGAVRDPVACLALEIRRENVRHTLSQERAEWISYYPPGVRQTWSVA